MVRLSLNITVISLLLWSSLATAQSYYNSSEALHQVDEGEHLFSVQNDWDRTHLKFIMSGNGEFLETNLNVQTLSYEYGLTQQYSFGVQTSYIVDDTVLYMGGGRLERYNEGFESLGMNWRYQKKWSHSQFHMKLAVKVPVCRARERETNASGLDKEGNGTLDHKRANLLLGYQKEVFYTHVFGVSFETTVFQTEGMKKTFHLNGTLDTNERLNGGEDQILKIFYEVPTLDQLFGGAIYYSKTKDTNEYDTISSSDSKFVNDHSINLEAYWRRPFFFKTEVLIRGNYGWQQENGDEKDPVYVFKAKSGTTYGGEITLRKYF